MWKIMQAVMLIFLGAGAIWDFRVRQVSTLYLISGTAGSVIFQAFSGQQPWYAWGLGLGIGGVFILLSGLTQEGIGYGDSWMILNLGVFLGYVKVIFVLIFAFAAAALAAGTGMAAGRWTRKTRIPFFPFLLVGYVGVLPW